MTEIPRIIHRIWLGPRPLPSEFEEYGKAWRRIMPDWDHRLWTEKDLPTLRNQDIYDNAPDPPDTAPRTRRHDRWRWRSDIVRLELLYAHGGVYVDCDTEPLKPLDPLLEGVECFAAYSANRMPDGSKVLTNATLGAVPGHPFIARLIEELPASVAQSGGEWGSGYGVPVKKTGPHFLNRIYQEGGWPSVTIFPAETFYPQSISSRNRGQRPDLSSAYTWHRWANSKRRARR